DLAGENEHDYSSVNKWERVASPYGSGLGKSAKPTRASSRLSSSLLSTDRAGRKKLPSPACRTRPRRPDRPTVLTSHRPEFPETTAEMPPPESTPPGPWPGWSGLPVCLATSPGTGPDVPKRTSSVRNRPSRTFPWGTDGRDIEGLNRKNDGPTHSREGK